MEDERYERVVRRAKAKRDAATFRIEDLHRQASIFQPDDLTTSQFLIAVNSLDELWEKFNVENECILDAMIEADKVSDFSYDEEIRVSNLVSNIKAVTCKYSDKGVNKSNESIVPKQTTANDGGSTSSSSTGESNGAVRKRPSRLPDIPLPKFDGRLKNWPVFCDRFVTSIHSDPDLADVDKFYFLLGCLNEDPAEVLRGITVSANTYNLAWDTLVHRFDKPRSLASDIIDELLSAPMSNQENSHSLTEFLNRFDEGVAVLQSLEIPDLGSFILFVLASRTLPLASRKLFEAENSATFPSFDELSQFVKRRLQVVENAGNQIKASSGSVRPLNSKETSTSVGPMKKKMDQQSNTKHPTALVTTKPSNSKCYCCKENHSLANCERFRQLSVDDRYKLVTGKRLCLVCFGEGHWANKCKLRCPVCSRQHHNLLHRELPPEPSTTTPQTSCLGNHDSVSVLLGTVLVHVKDDSGTSHTVRGLIDSASQISAITTDCASRLGLKISKWTAPISGLSGQSVPRVSGMTTCKVSSRSKGLPEFSVKAWVLPRITIDLPARQLPSMIHNKCANLDLADPRFDVPAPIELLLGADVFPLVWGDRSVALGEGLPSAFSTKFGWVLLGSITSPVMEDVSAMLVCMTSSIESMMEKFWSTEEPVDAPIQFTEAGNCETIFQSEVERDSDGRFVVPLPLREKVISSFPDSRAVAIKCFVQLEHKLAKDKVLHIHYCNFMNEYKDLNHMSPATTPGKYFIPHHGVCKGEAENLKLRVVFDSSARGVSGVSLNDCLYPGPKLQRDVIDVLLGFRLNRIAFTGDICKMYRQFWIHPKYRPLQHIFWRESPQEELKEFELNTVTYGLNCALYLALRIIKEIASLVADHAPNVSRTLLKQTYMDDICTGADSVEEALSLKTALVQTLAQFGLELKKWSSNSDKLLSTVKIEDRALCSISFSDVESVPVLGVTWNPDQDCFRYDVMSMKTIATKRGVLSLIARVFDPLGLLLPVIFRAKLIMQKIWRSQISWDDPLPSDLLEEWQTFVSDFPKLSEVAIQRFVGTSPGSSYCLCGFSDASIKGYAAVVYLRVVDAEYNVKVYLLGAKSKLAPMKQSTVPRLELCAAGLLSIWMSRISRTLEQQLVLSEVFCWTDSTIVLSWLTNPHTSFKVFVSNRIFKIHQTLPDCKWAYVRSEQNPADCVSRGLTPSELQSHRLDWSGPAFLLQPMHEWNLAIPKVPMTELPELRPISLLVSSTDTIDDFLKRFSSYGRLLRVVAWMRRFVNQNLGKSTDRGFLTQNELDEALVSAVKSTQNLFYRELQQELKTKTAVHPKGLSKVMPIS